jgi:peptidoglycan/LPS O-acetylase OafA/YrhL
VLTNPILWEFALGVIAYVLWKRYWMRRLRVPFAVLASLALCAYVVLLWMGKGGLEGIGLDGMIGNKSHGIETIDGTTAPARALYWGLPMFLLFCAIVGKESTSRPGSLLKQLGDASYSIYLSHLFVIMLMEAVVKRIPLHPDVVVVTSLTASAIAGIIVYRLVEKPMLVKGQSRVKTWSLRHVREAGS